METHRGAQPLAAILPQVVEETKQSGLKPPSCVPLPQAVTLLEDPKGKQELATILFQCFQSLKLYGKEPEALEATVAMFQIVLADYPFEKVKAAFAFYLKHSSELPAPADIANIIERGNKPPFDRAVYIAISKKQPEDRDKEEWAYMRDYERFTISGRN